VTALVAEHVSVRLSGRVIVQDVSFAAESGQLTAIVGPNAAGKTTLLKALAGLVDYQGDVRCGARALQGLSPAERALSIAYVPQRSLLNSMLSVREVVGLGRYAQRPGAFSLGARDAAAVDAALARVGIGALAARPYPLLSGGEQRLVLLARALVTGARTILLDEPTLSLDVRNALELFNLLGGLRAQGYCIVCVLHDLDEVLRHCDSALLLAGGNARFQGAPRTAAFNAAAEAVYGVRLVDADRVGFRLNEAPSC
jgi:iron complex transport system ATP-binding protein